MTIRLSLEEDSMRHALVRAFRSRGVDVITALEVGMLERPDDLHLEYATAQGRARRWPGVKALVLGMQEAPLDGAGAEAQRRTEERLEQ